MHIVYASDERYPHPVAHTVVITRTAQALLRAGVDVELLIPRVLEDYGAGSEAQRARIRATYGLEEDLPIRFLPWLPTTHARVQKVPHALAAALVGRARRPDVVLTRNLGIVAACKAVGLTVVMDHYRCYPHESPATWGRALPLWRQVDGLILHSKLLQDRWVSAGYPRARTCVAYTGHVPGDLRPRLGVAAARARVGLAGSAPVCVYTGNLGPHKGMDAVLDLAARLPQARFVLVGARDAREQRAVEAEGARRGLRNLQVVGFVPPVELAPYLYAADVLLVPPARAPMERFQRTALPLKLFTYLAAGRPICAPAMADVAELLHPGNALLVPADDAGAAAEALGRLLEDPARRARMGACARRESAEHTDDARARVMTGFLLGLLAGRRAGRPRAHFLGVAFTE